MSKQGLSLLLSLLLAACAAMPEQETPPGSAFPHRLMLQPESAFPQPKFSIRPEAIRDEHGRAHALFYQRRQAESASAVKSKPVPESASLRAQIMASARKQLGAPYLFGGSRPQMGFDCSGLMVYIHREHGIHLPRSSREQFAALMPVEQAQPGDLLFFRHGQDIDHVGLYLGQQQMLHAPRRGRPVRIERVDKPYWQKRFAGARRVQIP